MSREPLTVTASAGAAIEGVCAFESEVLRYGRNAARIFDIARDHPDCPLAQAYAALAQLFRTTREGYALSLPYLRTARKAARNGTRREQLFVTATARWQDEDQAGARAALIELLLAEPTDLFSAKLLQLLQFNIGDARGMLRTAAAVAPHHPDSAPAQAMLAFAFDQCGEHSLAERTARHAVALGNDPWAHHALAHVLDARSEFALGRAWLDTHADAWAECSSFLFTHNWWHHALFCLALGDEAAALRLYDDRVWTQRKDYCQDQINAVSLLARLELAGASVGDRWGEVAAHVAPHRTDVIDGFLDLHYAYALARAGRDSAFDDLLQASEEVNAPGAPRWRSLMPAAIAGIGAFAQGQHERALKILRPIAPSLHWLGGSTVQRDLLPRIIAAAEGRVERPGLAA